MPNMSQVAATSRLVVVRHGESTNNASGHFTGWRDIDLTERGREQARAAGALLAAHGLTFTVVYTSMLRRAIATADLLLEALGQPRLPRHERWQLNERHCGAMQGLTKDETYARFGAEAGREYRRSWHVPPPPAVAGSCDDPRTDARYRAAAGELPLTESMGDLWRRVDRLWHAELRPLLLRGERVLVVGHGMALRALAKSIEALPEPALPPWKLASAAPRCYRFAADLGVASIESLDNATAAPDE